MLCQGHVVSIRQWYPALDLSHAAPGLTPEERIQVRKSPVAPWIAGVVMRWYFAGGQPHCQACLDSQADSLRKAINDHIAESKMADRLAEARNALLLNRLPALLSELGKNQAALTIHPAGDKRRAYRLGQEPVPGRYDDGVAAVVVLADNQMTYWLGRKRLFGGYSASHGKVATLQTVGLLDVLKRYGLADGLA
jgi:hypothetical protein